MLQQVEAKINEGEEVRSLRVWDFRKIICIDMEIVSGLQRVMGMVLGRAIGYWVLKSSRNMAAVIQEIKNTCDKIISQWYSLSA